jgi:ABC-2 type transport system permease protein
MSAQAVLTASRPAPEPVATSADFVIARRAFRQVWVGATVWAVMFGATVATTALTYVSTFPDQASRDQIAASTAGDVGLSVLLGPIGAIDTVGGYTVYKCYVFLTTIAAIWGLLMATRLLRGEEDTGRWQLTLSGGTRASRATLATGAALGAAVAVLLVGTTVITALAGRDPDIGFGLGETILYGLSLAVPAATFAAIGMVTSQIGRSRRVATGLGMAIFGVAFVVRMIADSGPTTKWMLWLTPFGWTERMRPFTDNNWSPLLLAVIVVAILVAVAVNLSSRRDTGDGVLATRDVMPPREFGLGSLFGFAVRRETPVLIAWCAGAALASFSLGIVAKIATGAIPSSVGDMLQNFDVEGSFLRQFFGVAFLLVATLVALLPASQIGAVVEEETSGRLVQVLSRGAPRSALLSSRIALGAMAVVVSALVAGFGAWLGAMTQGFDPGFATMIGAGLNVAPTALVVLAFGALVFAVAPRAATYAVYAIVIASLVIDLFATLVTGLEWLDYVSLFHYMAFAPAQPVDAVTVFITLAVAAVLSVAAVALFTHRDVSTG